MLKLAWREMGGKDLCFTHGGWMVGWLAAWWDECLVAWRRCLVTSLVCSFLPFSSLSASSSLLVNLFVYLVVVPSPLSVSSPPPLHPSRVCCGLHRQGLIVCLFLLDAARAVISHVRWRARVGASGHLAVNYRDSGKQLDQSASLTPAVALHSLLEQRVLH